MQTYDPVYAGKQMVEQGKIGRRNPDPGQEGNRGPSPVNPVGHDRNSAGQGQPPRHLAPKPPQQRCSVGHASQHADDDPRANRYDDGYSAMEKAGYPRYERLVSEGVVGSRLGPHQLPAHDARNKLNRIYMSEILEEQGPPGPACFGPHIMSPE